MSKLNYKKKIAVITSTRADYGLLKNLILILQNSKSFDFKLIVCGSHLLKKFGNTISEIENDKIKISKKIKINIKKDKPFDASNFFLKIGTSINTYFQGTKLDGVILLGDRYEILSIASIAKIYNIPIIHLHGGESTYSLIDESIRHSITKLACLHFTSHHKYKSRLVKMGENPKNIFNFGGLGASNIKKTKLLQLNLIEKKLKIKIKKKYFLITFHPITLYNNKTKIEFINLLEALNKFKDTTFIFTSPNLDVDYQIIIKLIKEFQKKNKNSYFFKSLGSKVYYSLMKHSSAVVGNSSSGILEAPSFNVPTVNIGGRQDGRIQAISVINSKGEAKNIETALKKALSQKFKHKLKGNINPYYKKNTEIKIANMIKFKNLKEINKKFFYEKN